jgi:hypothetical protein
LRSDEASTRTRRAASARSPPPEVG